MTSGQTENKGILLGYGRTLIPLTVSYPVLNPPIPYVGKIAGEGNQDKAVVFQGTVPATATGFIINFKMGPLDSDDIAFHYNPCIGKYTNLNSYRSGNWESEYKIHGTPFSKGGGFIMIIAINSTYYEVSVNGVVHCLFKHRFDLNKVSTINVSGNVSLQLLGFIDSWSTTSAFKQLKAPQSTESSATKFKLSPLEISNLVIYPAIPHVLTVPPGIHQDKAVFVQGRIPADSAGFNLNFKTGPSPSHDIALHYNPRIGSNTTMNSFRNGKWDSEVNVPIKPFTKGEDFQMIIVPNSAGYEVYVNGSMHCVFKHRLPLEKVTTLIFQGALSQLICGFIHNWCTSSCCLELQKCIIQESIYSISKSISFQVMNVVSNPAIPYVAKIPGGLKKDMAFVFNGSVPTDSEGFSIHFKTGPAESDDFAFHFNPRIGNEIALNSLKGGNWGTEESIPNNSFTKGEDFQTIVLVTLDGYQVYVNGKSLCTYKHRIPIDKVSTIVLHECVKIYLLGFVENWRTK